MSKQSEIELRNKLRAEILKCDELRPSVEQDVIFQQNLEKKIIDNDLKYKSIKPSWFAAAAVVLTLGLFTFFGKDYLASDKRNITITQLIEASNQIESELSRLDKNELSSMQYIEALKIRDSIGELDSSLNVLYQNKSGSTDKEIHELWQQRLKMTQQLKAIYNNEYLVARI